MTDQPKNQQPNNDPLALLNSLIEQGASPEEFTRQLFDLNYHQAQKDDPSLAEMMQACAIPNAFDTTIIGILRDQPDEDETNARLLQALQTFEFVLPRQDGSYTYHDNTRDMLLARWQQPANTPQFEQYKTRLVAFYTAQGQHHYEQDAHQTALTHFNRALSLQPNDGLLHHWRGGTHLALGNYPAAQRDLEQALARSIKQVDTYFWLAIANYYLQDYLACSDNLTKVLELDPTNAAAYNNRGNRYAVLQQHERAIRDYDQAIQLNPDYATATLIGY
ncbi:tetratricopeptide repeat protein [Chloroflexi bacterium TSY]|nr:tetratricopeptide repeat protein [Chloroflexi bacterium TSY]